MPMSSLPRIAASLLVVGSALFCGSAATAQQPTPRQPAATVAGEAGQRLVLPLGEGRLVRFSRPAASVLVGDSTVADVEVLSPTAAFVFGRAVGRTNLIAVAADQSTVATVPIRVQSPIAPAGEALATLTPASGITVSFLDRRAVATGRAISVREAADAAAAVAEAQPQGVPVDRTALATANQIALRVRIAEVSRNELDRLGINWNALVETGNFAFGVATGAFLPGGSLGEAFGAISALFSSGRNRVEALLEALQREGVVTLLAEPNLVTLNGQPASFLAGGELAVPVPQGDGVITVAFKPFGVALEFVPSLLPNGLIGMRVKPEVSTPVGGGVAVAGGFVVPSLSVRRADVAVELASGQTLAIAGLFQRNRQEVLQGLPLLGQLPVLGPLFRSQRFQRDETELLILITPTLVRPPPRPAQTTPFAQAAPAARPAAGRVAAGFLVD